MDMGDTMPMGGASSDSPLNATGFDLTNATDAATFLGEILDDTVFQIDGNMYARNFWYGVCAIIGVCALFNATQKVTFNLRYESRQVSWVSC
jgi:ferric-chelate reductase